MWRIWLFFGIFEISFGAPVDTPQDPLPSGDLPLLRCLMLTSPHASCDVTKRVPRDKDLPHRLQSLYRKVREEDGRRGMLGQAGMEEMHPTLLYLVPKVRLSAMEGRTAANILRKMPFDDAMAMKLTSLLTDERRREEFLRELQGSESDHDSDYPSLETTPLYPAPLSPSVQFELGHALSRWYPNASSWEYRHFDLTTRGPAPLLALLPPPWLAAMAAKPAEKFLFHLRNWGGSVEPPLAAKLWARHANAVKRVWAHIMLTKGDSPRRWSPHLLQQLSFLLLGATPTELSALPSSPSLSLPWSASQARTLYHSHNGEWAESERGNEGLLLPSQMRGYGGERRVEGASLPTQKQLLESLIAESVQKNILPSVSPASWNNDTSVLGKLVHLLPSSSLAVFANKTLSVATLLKIDSPAFQYRQARYLSHPLPPLTPLPPLHSLLKSLPSSHLAALPSNLLPQASLEHLLLHSAGDSPARIMAVLDMLGDDFADGSFLGHLLRNKDHPAFLNLLNSRDMYKQHGRLTQSLQRLVETSPELEKQVRALPERFLSTLLSAQRAAVLQRTGSWSYDDILSPSLKMLSAGLTCDDLAALEVADVVPVLGYYVREKKALGQMFPLNLQYCSQTALTSYLALKASLRGLDPEVSGLLNLLESHEVKALGGFVLASLPLDLLTSSHLRGQILVEVGGLSLPELLVAVKPNSLPTLASSLTQSQPVIDLRGMTRLGNLLWFLPETELRKLNMGDARLLIESLEPGRSTALCLDAKGRANWRSILLQVFGKPESWSSTTVELLGDLLLVFSELDLEGVAHSAWVEVADQLVRKSEFHLTMDWPGRTRPVKYYQACLESLPKEEKTSYLKSLRGLMRFYLEAAQLQLDTVLPAGELMRASEEQNQVQDVEPVELTSTTRTERTTTERSTTRRPWEREEVVEPVEEEYPEDEARDWVDDYYDELEGKKEAEGRIKREVWEGSVEDKREELRRNASRDLVVEVVQEPEEEGSTELVRRRGVRISCDALRMLGPAASLALQHSDVTAMRDVELEDCSETLGSLGLPEDLKRTVLSRLHDWRLSGNLLELGDLVTGLEDLDIANISLRLEQDWALENLALLSQHVTNIDMLSVIADQFWLENHDAPSLPSLPLSSLGPLACLLPPAPLLRLLKASPASLRRAAPRLAASLPPGEPLLEACLGTLAGVAKEVEAFGPPRDWTASDVATLDVIVAGLPASDWHNGLQPAALSGLSPAAVASIPPRVFKELSEEQLSHLLPLSVAAISPSQSSTLSPSQSEVLDRVRRQIPDIHLRASRSGAQPLVHPSLHYVALGAAVVASLSRTLVAL